MFVKIDAIRIVNLMHVVFVEGYDADDGMILYMDNGNHFAVDPEYIESVKEKFTACNHAVKRMAIGNFY